MGCVNSTKNLHNENIFHVSIVRIQPQLASMPHHGQLELTSHELIFRSPNREPITWPLQHLRRYGLNGSAFSFESGRRCLMGARIYTFRCYQADLLYQKFQQYVNGVGEISLQRPGSGIINSRQIQDGSHTEANHYQVQVTSIPFIADENQHVRSPQAYNHNTLSVPPNNRNIEAENNCRNQPRLSIADASYLGGNHLVNTTSVSSNTISTNNNIYMKQPFRSLVDQDCKDFRMHSRTLCENGISQPSSRRHITHSCSGNCSEYSPSNVNRNPLPKNNGNRHQESETQPYYMNVQTTDIQTTNSTSVKMMNLTNLYPSLIASDSGHLEGSLAFLESQEEHCENLSPNLQDKMQDHRPAHLMNNGLEFVNYIVLDLDNADSPLPQNTANRTNFENNELLFLTEKADLNDISILTGNSPIKRSTPAMSSINNAMTGNSPIKRSTPAMSSINNAMTTFAGAMNSNASVESYSTIDFVRTSALLNQSNDIDNIDKLDQCEEEESEFRLTRHSKYISTAFNDDEQLEM